MYNSSSDTVGKKNLWRWGSDQWLPDVLSEGGMDKAQGVSKPAEPVCVTTVEACHHALVQTCRRDIAKGEPRVTCGLWVMMTWQCRFISCDKCALCGGW